MTPVAQVSAAQIAMDLATVIHGGLIALDEKVPTAEHLSSVYGVDQATAQRALDLLRQAELTEARHSRFFRPDDEIADRVPDRPRHGPIPLLYRAGDVLISEAATQCSDSADPAFYVDDRWNYEDHEPDPRRVSAAALTGLDREMLRALGHAMHAAARRAVGYGLSDTERFLTDVARVILQGGAVRPEGQVPIAEMPGPASEADGASARVFPRASVDGPF